MTDVRFSADRIASVTVLGAGTMGHGIAHVAALAGCRAVIYDLDPAVAAAAIDKVTANLDKGVKLGKLDLTARDQAVARLRAVSDLAEACRDADCVIEAVPEILELKTQLFGQVDRAAPAHAD